jgi:type 1 fimbria pilin
MKTKLLSVLCALGILLTFSFAARAEAISEHSFNTLLDSGATVNLEKVVSSSCTITLGSSITISGNGYTINTYNIDGKDVATIYATNGSSGASACDLGVGTKLTIGSEKGEYEVSSYTVGSLGVTVIAPGGGNHNGN